MATHHIAVYLLTTAVGYWVLTLAEKEKNNNKKIGKIIGWVIIGVSLCGCLCLAGRAVLCHPRYGQCSSFQSCPWSGMSQGNGPQDAPEKSK